MVLVLLLLHTCRDANVERSNVASSDAYDYAYAYNVAAICATANDVRKVM